MLDVFRLFNLYRNGGQCPPYKLLKPQVEHVDESTVKTGGMNVFEEYNLYEAGDFGYHECRIPALLTTANGTILAFNEARKFTGSDSDQIDLFLRRSFDGGRSFEDVQVVTTKDGWVSGNPVPVQDRTTGTIWLLFCRNQTEKISTLEVSRSIWVTSSNDDGGNVE